MQHQHERQHQPTHTRLRNAGLDGLEDRFVYHICHRRDGDRHREGPSAPELLLTHLAASPRPVLEMVGASFHERSAFSQRSTCAIGTPSRSVGGQREGFFRFLGPSCRLARGALRRSVSGTLFPHRPRRTKLLVGAIEPPQNGAQNRPSSAFERRRQVGGPAPRALPSPGAACAGGAPTRPRPRARAVRPARGNPWGRSGRLHAPEAARTGPVNALRRYCTVSREGAGSNGHNGHFLGQPTRPWVGTPRGVTQVRWAYPTDFWRILANSRSPWTMGSR